MSLKCEHCGAPMVQKKAMRGSNAGNSFWGCSQWKAGEKHSTYNDVDGSAEAADKLFEPSGEELQPRIKTRERNSKTSSIVKKVLWTDFADRRDGWITRYSQGGARLRSLPSELEEDVSKEYGTCWIATSDVDSYMPADPHTQRVLAMARKLLQRGRLPFADPRVESELLSMAGIETNEPSEGQVGLKPRKPVAKSDVPDDIAWQQKNSLDEHLEFESPYEKSVLKALFAIPNAGRYVTCQAPLDALASGLGRASSGSRRVDFLVTDRQSSVVIEIDGAQHAEDGADADRDELLRLVDVSVLRVATDDVETENWEKSVKSLNVNWPSGKLNPLVHGPIQVHRLELALLESVRRGFLAGDVWSIELNDPTNWALTCFESGLNLLRAVDQLWGQQFMPRVVQVQLGSETKTWSLNQSAYEQVDQSILPVDVRVDLDLGLSPLHELPKVSSIPVVVIRDAPLPVRVQDAQGEPTVRTAPSLPEDELSGPLRTILQSIFALDDFREGQLEAISEVVAGRDCVVLLPTGAGKSLVYQMAGLILPGRTIVIDPLVALMEDQERSLRAQSIDRIVALSSFTSQSGDSQAALQQVESGDALFVFLAPERLQIPQFRQALRVLAASSPINLAVIDEAHCVSEWGHDFRTAYLNVGKTLRAFGADSLGQAPPLLALTGTASRAVLKDVLNDLAITQQSGNTLIKPRTFDRPELRFRIELTQPSNAEATLKGLVQGMADQFGENPATFFASKSRRPHPGIVFVPHTNGAYGIVHVAKEVGNVTQAEALRYSGGSPKGFDRKDWEFEKRAAAQKFMKDEVPILVTTKAFGMGIDKPNIRYVIHYGIPGSIESYYQEVGRAGRDRKTAYCSLILSELDPKRSARLLADTTELEDLHNHVAASSNPNQSDDLDRQLFFYTNSFKGIATEVAAVESLLDDLEPLGQAHIVQLGFGSDDTIREKQEKALHRLAILGVVTDYTKDWGSKRFEVIIGESTPETIAASLVTFVERSQPGRSAGMLERLTTASEGKTREAIQNSVQILTEFIYETIASARKRSLREMLLAARENRGDEAGFRKRILDYLQEGDVAPLIEGLADSDDFNLMDWINALMDIVTNDEAQEWRGSSARLLTSYPEQPGLLISRGYSELIISDGDVEEAVTNMKVGFGSALKNYATSEHDVLVAATKMIDSRLSQGFPNQGLAILASCAEYLTPPDFSTALGSIDSFDPNLPAISVLRLNKGLTELLDTLNTMILEEV
jgi:ATP-dependent DNA helicase RecQ